MESARPADETVVVFLALPFMKHPESNEMFATFFTKPWQDALQLSLFNYLSVIFQSMPTPSLMDAQRVAMNNSKVTSYILVCLQVKLYRRFLFLV